MMIRILRAGASSANQPEDHDSDNGGDKPHRPHRPLGHGGGLLHGAFHVAGKGRTENAFKRDDEPNGEEDIVNGSLPSGSYENAYCVLLSALVRPRGLFRYLKKSESGEMTSFVSPAFRPAS